MKRQYSLKGRDLFKEVYQKGGKFQDKGLQIFVLRFDSDHKKNSNKKILSNIKTTKIGLAINKKYGKAFMRNKVKRRIRSICSELLDEMNSGYYVIIKPESDFKNIGYDESKLKIKLLLKKAGVVNR